MQAHDDGIFPTIWLPGRDSPVLRWGQAHPSASSDIVRQPFSCVIANETRWAGELLICPVDGLITVALRPIGPGLPGVHVAALLGLTTGGLDPTHTAIDDMGLTVVRTRESVIAFDSLEGTVTLTPRNP